jgi:hypothetical protein
VGLAVSIQGTVDCRKKLVILFDILTRIYASALAIGTRNDGIFAQLDAPQPVEVGQLERTRSDIQICFQKEMGMASCNVERPPRTFNGHIADVEGEAMWVWVRVRSNARGSQAKSMRGGLGPFKIPRV